VIVRARFNLEAAAGAEFRGNQENNE